MSKSTKSSFEKDIENIINRHYKVFLKNFRDNFMSDSKYSSKKDVNNMLLNARNEVEAKHGYGKPLPLVNRIMLSEKLIITKKKAGKLLLSKFGK